MTNIYLVTCGALVPITVIAIVLTANSTSLLRSWSTVLLRRAAWLDAVKQLKVRMKDGGGEGGETGETAAKPARVRAVVAGGPMWTSKRTKRTEKTIQEVAK